MFHIPPPVKSDTMVQYQFTQASRISDLHLSYNHSLDKIFSVVLWCILLGEIYPDYYHLYKSNLLRDL